MRVLHVIPSLDPRDGGPSIALPHMAAGLVDAGIEVHVATTIDRKEATLKGITLGKPTQADSWTCYFFARQLAFYKVSLPLLMWLRRHAANYDLIHVHALFSFAPIAACMAARRNGVPYVVRPLGVLNEWGMEHRRKLVKALSFHVVERPLLDQAAAIHYTSVSEQQEASRLNLKGRPVVIPLGIDTSSFHRMQDRLPFERKFPQSKGRELILFLSRLHPKKGLEILIQALERIVKSHPRSLLVIAGSGADDFTEALNTMVNELGIKDHVLWCGFLGPEDKRSALSAADVFVLPSRSENFGIALLEAMASGVPCVSTSGVALGEEAAAVGAAQIAALDAESIASAVTNLLDSPEQRSRFAEAGKTFADSRYSLQVMGKNLAKMYRELSN